MLKTRIFALVVVAGMVVLSMPVMLTLGTGSSPAVDEPRKQEMTTTSVATAVNESANITFGNQSSVGLENTSLVVERVVVPNGGFIVLYNTTNSSEGNGITTVDEGETQHFQPDQVLGNSTYLEPGVHRSVVVEMNQPFEEPAESIVLMAIPHQDTNANQHFDFPSADAPYETNGQPVSDWAFVNVTGPTR